MYFSFQLDSFSTGILQHYPSISVFSNRCLVSYYREGSTPVAYSTNCWMTLSCFFSSTALIFLICSFAISDSKYWLCYVKPQRFWVSWYILCRYASISAPPIILARSYLVWFSRRGGRTWRYHHFRLFFIKSTDFAKCWFGESVYHL